MKKRFYHVGEKIGRIQSFARKAASKERPANRGASKAAERVRVYKWSIALSSWSTWSDEKTEGYVISPTTRPFLCRRDLHVEKDANSPDRRTVQVWIWRVGRQGGGEEEEVGGWGGVRVREEEGRRRGGGGGWTRWRGGDPDERFAGPGNSHPSLRESRTDRWSCTLVMVNMVGRKNGRLRDLSDKETGCRTTPPSD